MYCIPNSLYHEYFNKLAIERSELLKNYKYGNNPRKATAIRNVCRNRDYRIRHLKRKRAIKEDQFGQWDTNSTNPRKEKLQRDLEEIDRRTERITAKAMKEIQEIQVGHVSVKRTSTSSTSSWFEYYDSNCSEIESTSLANLQRSKL